MPAVRPPYEVRPSRLHGRGLFARRALRAGAVIGVAEGRVVQRDGEHVLWIHDEETNREYGLRITNDLRFVNHADDANAHFDGERLLARRAIARGEEITFDYDSADGVDEGELTGAGGAA